MDNYEKNTFHPICRSYSYLASTDKSNHEQYQKDFNLWKKTVKQED
ncbi:hypothetical protein [Halobacillus halophilus]|nr:hypothetical protein [Halobacillus halophilus]